MTRTNEQFVTEKLREASTKYGQTTSGRIIAGLASGNPGKVELGNFLLAALLQDVDRKFYDYLAPALSGDPSTASTPQSSDPEGERPVYTRPNGKPYYARKWGDFWDVSVLKAARKIEQFPLLQGPPGTGKTAMAEAAFGDELVTIVINADTTVGELVGSFIPDGEGGYVWVDGPLLVAVKEGRPILLDEILLGDPKVLSVLYPLMDGRGFVDVSENPKIGIVPAKDGFFIIGTGNPGVPGARMSEALSSRFPLQVEVTTDFELAKSLGTNPHVVTFAKSLATRASGPNPSISWAPQFREMMAFDVVEREWGLLFAVQNLLRTCPRRDLEEVRAAAASVWPALDLKAARI